MYIRPRSPSVDPRAATISGLTLWSLVTVLLVSIVATLTFTHVIGASAEPSMSLFEPAAIGATGLLAYCGLERRGVLLPSLLALGALLVAFPMMLLQVAAGDPATGWQPVAVVRFGLHALALGALVLWAPDAPPVGQRPPRRAARRSDGVPSGLVTLLPPRAPHENLPQRRHRRRHRYLRVD